MYWLDCSHPISHASPSSSAFAAQSAAERKAGTLKGDASVGDSCQLGIRAEMREVTVKYASAPRQATDDGLAVDRSVYRAVI